MSDRLAEIEAAASQGHHEWWDRAHAMRDLRDLLAVAKAAREWRSASARLYADAHGSDPTAEAEERLRVAEDALDAALANLEGGA